MYPNSFDQCLAKRNAENYVGQVKTQLKQLPWKDEALPAIKNFAVSKKIIAGFKKVDEYENAANKEGPEIQLAHLIEIAKHKQGVILQPLIYENKSFAARVGLQRAWYANWASPPIELVFTHACSTEGAHLKSVAPEGTKLESFDSRMKWILNAANEFHFLMQQKAPAMEKELKTMADWNDMADSLTNMEKIKQKARQIKALLD